MGTVKKSHPLVPLGEQLFAVHPRGNLSAGWHCLCVCDPSVCSALQVVFSAFALYSFSKMISLL